MKGKVIWLTGLSGAGKTTLAHALFKKLNEMEKPVEILDGDVLRQNFFNGGFSKEDRDQHVKRVGYIASLLEKHQVIVICSLISPYRESREIARGLCQNFIEVYVSTPLNVCESRDPKGLYKNARQGVIKNFTGLDDPYEVPIQPEINIDTSQKSVEQCAEIILSKLLQ